MNDIQHLKSLVDEHLYSFQPDPLHSPANDDKFIRLSNSTLDGNSSPGIARKPLQHNDHELLSSYTYQVTANHPPVSPKPSPPATIPVQLPSRMSNKFQPDFSPNHQAPSSNTTTYSIDGTPHTASPNTLTPSLTPSQKADMSDPESQKAREWRPQRSEYLIMGTLAWGSFLAAIDSMILIAALPPIATDLNGTTTEAFWAGSAYLLPYAVMQPFLANLSEIFGRRPLLLISLALFLVGSLPCALAENMINLLAGRVVQGIGGGGVVALSQAVYTDIVPLRQRPKWYGIVLLSWAIGTMIGPVIGGGFTDMSDDGWRWCFWINFPVGGIGLVLSWFLVRLESTSSPLTLGQKLRTVDYIGGVLFIGSITSALVALSWGGNTYAWNSAQTLTPLLVGLVGLAAFAAYERYVAKYPFVQRSVFPSWSAVVLFVLALLYGLVLFQAIWWIFYFTSVRLFSATRSGANMVAAFAVAVPASMVCGVLMTRWGRFRWAIWGGQALECLGYGLMIRFDEVTPAAAWAVFLCLAGLGSGMSLSSINFGVQTTARTDRDSAAATVTYTFLRSVGMCVGVSLGSTVFQDVAAAALVSRGLDGAIARNAEVYAHGTLRFLAPEEELRRDVVAAFVEGVQGVFVVVTAVKAAGFLLSLVVRRQNVDRELDGHYKAVGAGHAQEKVGRAAGPAAAAAAATTGM